MSLSTPEAIIFDVYDTLFANSPDRWQEAFADIAIEQKLPYDGPGLWKRWKVYEVNFRATRTNMEDPKNNPRFKSYEQAWAECFQKVFDEDRVQADSALSARRSVEHMARRDPYPETLEAIEALGKSHRLAVFSNADDAFVRPLIKEHGLRFEYVFSSESARIYKPHPDAFKRVLGRLGLSAEVCWYVGDHLWDDVYGSAQVGMQPIWINRDGREFDGKIRPAQEIASLLELPQLAAAAR
jgi:2-haloalkanoic acid dehalogenase type II